MGHRRGKLKFAFNHRTVKILKINFSVDGKNSFYLLIHLKNGIKEFTSLDVAPLMIDDSSKGSNLNPISTLPNGTVTKVSTR